MSCNYSGRNSRRLLVLAANQTFSIRQFSIHARYLACRRESSLSADWRSHDSTCMRSLENCNVRPRHSRPPLTTASFLPLPSAARHITHQRLVSPLCQASNASLRSCISVSASNDEINYQCQALLETDLSHNSNAVTVLEPIRLQSGGIFVEDLLPSGYQPSPGLFVWW